MIEKINHVAIAVSDLDVALEHYKGRYGLAPVSREAIESEGVEEAMLEVGESYIQLIAPTRSDSPVARFIERQGEGLHHIAYEVSDLVGTLEHLRKEGARLVDDAPRQGGGGTLVAFVHPRDGLGTLIELVET